MKKNHFISSAIMLSLVLLAVTNSTQAQNIGINATGLAPNTSAGLDIDFTNKGLLVPRVALTSLTSSATPIASPATSLLVYNTYTPLIIPASNKHIPGYYYWNGTEWTRLFTTGDAWELKGNAGTTASINFLGTTDNISLVIRTNNIERMRILNDGRVAVNSIGTFTTSTFYSAATGNDNAIDGNAAGTGDAVYGQNTGTGSGVYGLTNNSSGLGITGVNITTAGTGALFAGQNAPGYYSFPLGSGIAVNGTTKGVVSIAQANDGWGVMASGNNITSLSSLAEGGGGAFTGRQWGVFSFVNTSTNSQDRAVFVGNYNYINSSTATVYVGARIGGTHYKILGTSGGSVSTTMPTRDGERILFAPEAPENWFFDLGEVTLKDGKAEVNLDPLFVDCISDSKPFKVFVQGAENTDGNIRVTRNQEDKSFVLEDLGGSSNGIVQYKIYGIWKTKENLRFPKYEEPININSNELKKSEVNKEVKIKNTTLKENN